jgi:hypothetical protein
MKTYAYFLPCLFLFVFSFGIAHTAAYSQQKDVVLVQGNPPLTQLMVGKVIVLLDWALELKLSKEQELKIKDVLIHSWQTNDREDIQGALDIIEIYEKVSRLSENERNNARGKLQEVILQSIRSEPNDELARMLLSAYQAAHSKPSKTVPQSNSSPTQSNSSATTTRSKLRVGADGFTGIYRMVRPKALNIHRTIGESGYTIEYITFLPGGYVFWRLPSEGLLYFDPAVAQRAYPDDWGTYEIKNGEIHVLRGPQKKLYVITRNGERLNNPPSLGKGSFRPVPASDGLKLEGTYRWSENTPAIVFTKDGNFRDEGFFTGVDAVKPDGTFYKRDTRGGSGTYVIEQYTLELRYSDGRVKRFPFIVFQEQLAQEPALDSFILYYNDVIKRY